MTWRDRIDDAQGSYRGVPFYVERAGLGHGRRVQVHEYPLRDDPWPEDLGRKAREYNIDVYLLGDDYDLQRNRLLEAIEEPGPGTLVHPHYGTLEVSITDARVRESTREGGVARFSITFVEHEPARFPDTGIDTVATVDEAAGAARQSAVDVFLERFDVVGLTADRIAAVQRELDWALQDLDAAVGDVTGALADIIRAPAELAGLIIGSLSRLRHTITEPARALGIYSRLFTSGGRGPLSFSGSMGGDSPADRRQQAVASRVAQALVRHAAVIQAVEDAAHTEFEASDDALEHQRVLSDGIEWQLQAADDLASAAAPMEAGARMAVAGEISEALYSRLLSLNAAMVRDLETRGAGLPRLREWVPQQSLPALVIAHQVYGDARRDSEIIRRNRIRHPGRVPGGMVLEVFGD